MASQNQIVTINYRALKFDDHQGGSGMPFEGQMILNFDVDISLKVLSDRVEQILDRIITSQFVGEVDLINIELN